MPLVCQATFPGARGGSSIVAGTFSASGLTGPDNRKVEIWPGVISAANWQRSASARTGLKQLL